MNSKKIWIIDDDPIFRMIVSTIAKNARSPWEVEEFETVQLANTALHESTEIPDAILLDVNIPVGGGWVFLEEFERLRCEKGNSPLYVCSSSIDESDKQRAAQSLCVRQFIEKPLPFDFFDGLGARG